MKLKHLLIVPKQVYQTDKNKIIKAFAYSPETGLPDRKKKEIKASAYSPAGLLDRKKTN